MGRQEVVWMPVKITHFRATAKSDDLATCSRKK